MDRKLDLRKTSHPSGCTQADLKYVLSERKVSVDTLKEEKHISNSLVKYEGARILRKSSKLHHQSNSGFTLVELIIVMVVIGILTSFMFSIFNNTFNQYFALQREGTNFTDLASQSHRISNVLRGATDVTVANKSELEVYAYFAPSDLYVSKIRYYKNATGKKILADITNMTANPPIGVPIPSSLKTYTILDNFTTVSGIDLFDYLSSAGEELPMPITDLTTIKGIKVNLAVPTSNANVNQSVSVQVNLRNRKTNL